MKRLLFALHHRGTLPPCFSLQRCRNSESLCAILRLPRFNPPAAQVLLKFHCGAQRGSSNCRSNMRAQTGPERGGKAYLCFLCTSRLTLKRVELLLGRNRSGVARDCVWHRCPFPWPPLLKMRGTYVFVVFLPVSVSRSFTAVSEKTPLICHLHIGGGASPCPWPLPAVRGPHSGAPASRKVSL